MYFLAWVFCVFLTYFFYSTLPFLSATWMFVPAIAFGVISALFVLMLTLFLIFGENR